MRAVIRAHALGKKYRRRWALSDCTLDIPAGRVVGLVGPNGAGKSTLLNLASGMLTPTTGTIEVCGGRPGGGPAQLAKVGFVAQDTPTYASLSVADHLTLGARLNSAWDDQLARDRIRRLNLDPARRAGQLSGGQRAQLALTLGLAKRPELLILDEPVAALDPLARRDFTHDLQEAIGQQEMSVVLSSHLVSDVERVCDHLIVLVDSTVQVTGAIDDLLATHRRLVGPRSEPVSAPVGAHIVSAEHTAGQTILVVRTDVPVHDPRWSAAPLPLEDIVLAYMRRVTDASPVSLPASKPQETLR
ncbi:ABC transporter ATP-binding protein [Streptomyces sp. NPDC046909]|uniref:ABC transporter ATP-binding protein n=1 Tax=Streptomyces sp. NPDC046909 TaxID=3155617 RepID=UPI0033EB901A